MNTVVYEYLQYGTHIRIYVRDRREVIFKIDLDIHKQTLWSFDIAYAPTLTLINLIRNHIIFIVLLQLETALAQQWLLQLLHFSLRYLFLIEERTQRNM